MSTRRLNLMTLSQDGGSLIELLIAMTFFLMIAGTYMNSSTQVLNVRSRTERQIAATQLANERMELLLMRDPAVLSAADNSNTEVTREYQGLVLAFQEIVTITVNGDESRTVAISETSLDTPDLSVEIANRIPLRGSH